MPNVWRAVIPIFLSSIVFLKLKRKDCGGKILLWALQVELACSKPPAVGVSMRIAAGGRRGVGILAPLSTRASSMLFSEAAKGSAKSLNLG